MEFFEKKSPLLLKIALINHAAICLIFTIIFLVLKGDSIDIYYQIYICSILFLFLIYMLYFAYHSVNKFFIYRFREHIKQSCTCFS